MFSLEDGDSDVHSDEEDERFETSDQSAPYANFWKTVFIVVFVAVVLVRLVLALAFWWPVPLLVVLPEFNRTDLLAVELECEFSSWRQYPIVTSPDLSLSPHDSPDRHASTKLVAHREASVGGDEFERQRDASEGPERDSVPVRTCAE